MDLCNQEACWYNFETRSRDWQDPWHETAEHTALMMHGHSYQQSERGESCSYHIYFYGYACDAPHLPPEKGGLRTEYFNT